jgi:GNAT superfamily N-acetyltransferase
LVAGVGGVVVGGLLAREFCNWDSALVGYRELTEDDVVPFASLMCVAEHLRGEGIGTQLVTNWIESTPSWAHVVMPDASDDEPSRAARGAFFEHLGFRWIRTAYDGLEPWLMIRQTSGPVR